MIKILQVVNKMDRAGIENMLMNYYRNIDRDKIQFDFLTHRAECGAFDEEIKSLGGNVYYAPRLYPWNYKSYFVYMERFFSEHKEYSIVHSHIDAMSFLPLLAAKRANIPIRIAHSHNTGLDLDYKYFLKQFFRHRIKKVANYYCACTNPAGKFLFGEKEFVVIPNAIDESRFEYNELTRNEIRKKLGFENNFVIGHVGRFEYQKNHYFLLKVFDKIQKDIPDVKLLLIGDGKNKDFIKSVIIKRGISDKVIILDNLRNIQDYYQSMDLFVLPSRFEGLGICAVEAQVSGLKTILSENVPREASISYDTVFLPLKKDLWISEIKKIYETKSMRKTVYSDYYDILSASKRMEVFYKELIGEKC